MKYTILIMMSLICFSWSLKAQKKQECDTIAQVEKKRVLVAYFSCTGTTEGVADSIAKAVGGKLYRITPLKPYTAADLDWTDKKSRSSVEMNTEDSRPELGGEPVNPDDYDVIFLGYPIWWDLCPRPVNTFLERYDFTGKVVIPFATSGGSAITRSVKDLKRLYPSVTWKEGKLLNGEREEAGRWAKQVMKQQ